MIIKLKLNFYFYTKNVLINAWNVIQTKTKKKHKFNNTEIKEIAFDFYINKNAIYRPLKMKCNSKKKNKHKNVFF